MKIYKHVFIDLPQDLWRQLWKETLRRTHACPLTGSLVQRSQGQCFVRVKYTLDGILYTEERAVLFEENHPSLSSQSSEAYSACICIVGTGELEVLSIEDLQPSRDI